MSNYQTVGDGDILSIADDSIFFLACCECGLVHEIFATRNNKEKRTLLRFRVNGRRSYMKRKWMIIRKEGVFRDDGRKT